MGKPLFVDAATASGLRPSVARVCVEVDLLKAFPGRIWIGNGDYGGFGSSWFQNMFPGIALIAFAKAMVMKIVDCSIQRHGQQRCSRRSRRTKRSLG